MDRNCGIPEVLTAPEGDGRGHGAASAGQGTNSAVNGGGGPPSGGYREHQCQDCGSICVPRTDVRPQTWTRLARSQAAPRPSQSSHRYVNPHIPDVRLEVCNATLTNQLVVDMGIGRLILVCPLAAGRLAPRTASS